MITCSSGAFAGKSPPGRVHNVEIQQIGIASWYGRSHAGHRTFNEERFNPQAMTCAHKTLPMNSIIKITNVITNTSVVCRVNDRGPFIRGRIVDCAERVAKLLGVGNKGIMRVRIDVLRIGLMKNTFMEALVVD